MEPLAIRRISIADLRNAHDVGDLLREYAAESAIDGLPEPRAHWDSYELIESGGALQVIGAYSSGQMVGFAVVLVNVSPHYSVPLAVTESLFVRPSYRHCGAGMALLREAARVGRERGAGGLLVSAPTDGTLATVLSRMSGFRETNRVFFQRLGDA